MSDDEKTKEQLIRELNELRSRVSLSQYSIDHASDIVFWVKPDSRFYYVNDAACSMLGYSKDELLTLSIPDIDMDPKYSREHWAAHWEDLKKRKSFTFESRYRRKDGGSFPVEITVNYLKFAGKEYDFAYVKDISRRKLAEHLLEQRHWEVMTLLDSLPAQIFFKDTKGTYLMANQRMCNALGRSLPDIIGKTDFELFPPDLSEKYQRGDTKVISTGEPIFRDEKALYKGRRIDVAVRKVPLKDETGNVTGIIGIALDISELKRTEKALKDAKSQAELYVDLMGHDINNMNQIAMGYLELALNGLMLKGKLMDSDRSLLEKPIEALSSSSKLIDNVRKLQREKAGEITPMAIDLNKTLQQIKKQYSTVPGRDITIRFSPSKSCSVMANELLAEVFSNLVGNAVKHSEGPLTISLALETFEENGKRYCKAMVEDNGPGIPDDMKKRLFDRLCLLRAKSGGKGFGLCLIKMLLDDFNGKFWVEDRVPGDHTRGCRFVVVLPAI